MTDKTKQIVVASALLAAAVGGFLIFGQDLGLVVFLAVGVLALVQLFRVIVANGHSKTLKDLWSAFKDAFWGIG